MNPKDRHDLTAAPGRTAPAGAPLDDDEALSPELAPVFAACADLSTLVWQIDRLVRESLSSWPTDEALARRNALRDHLDQLEQRLLTWLPERHERIVVMVSAANLRYQAMITEGAPPGIDEAASQPEPALPSPTSPPTEQLRRAQRGAALLSSRFEALAGPLQAALAGRGAWGEATGAWSEADEALDALSEELAPLAEGVGLTLPTAQPPGDEELADEPWEDERILGCVQMATAQTGTLLAVLHRLDRAGMDGAAVSAAGLREALSALAVLRSLSRGLARALLARRPGPSAQELADAAAAVSDAPTPDDLLLVLQSLSSLAPMVQFLMGGGIDAMACAAATLKDATDRLEGVMTRQEQAVEEMVLRLREVVERMEGLRRREAKADPDRGG